MVSPPPRTVQLLSQPLPPEKPALSQSSLAIVPGAGAGVAVGAGTEVDVGVGTGVAVGGTGVAVPGTGVAVGGNGVAVPGTGVAVAGMGVGVAVGTGVAVTSGVANGVGVKGGGSVGVAVGMAVGPGVGGGEPSCTVTEVPGSTCTAVSWLVIVRIAPLSGRFSIPETELVTGVTLIRALRGTVATKSPASGTSMGPWTTSTIRDPQVSFTTSPMERSNVDSLVTRPV